MTTPKKPFSLEFAIFEAMQLPPRGIGKSAVAAILHKSTDMLYKATNPTNDDARIWSISSASGLIDLAASLLAAGVPDHIMPALIHERNMRAERIMENDDDIDKATAKMLHSVSSAVLHLTSARDPESQDGMEISDEEARLIMAALDEAQTAIKQKQNAIMSSISKRKCQGA